MVDLNIGLIYEHAVIIMRAAIRILHTTLVDRQRRILWSFNFHYIFIKIITIVRELSQVKLWVRRTDHGNEAWRVAYGGIKRTFTSHIECTLIRAVTLPRSIAPLLYRTGDLYCVKFWICLHGGVARSELLQIGVKCVYRNYGGSWVVRTTGGMHAVFVP